MNKEITKWNGKNKAVTFSFDDGITQDKRLIEILDRYGLKATFNLNSDLLGLSGMLERNGKTVTHNKIAASDVAETYKRHEVAVHTLTHPNLTKLSREEIIKQTEDDRKALEALTGYDICCMAYPCGGVNNNKRVAEIIKEHTAIRFARTIKSTHNFDLQTNMYRFNPSVYFIETKKLFALGEKFVNMKTDKPQLFYIWGHSFELDAEYITWQRFEEFCKLIAFKDDIFYGTNRECCL